ncbi:MAG TPA: hypothetical protein VGS03_06860 [Candidatus Polarisedimenticolia bacterium]|jgi:hypothetical protein|nr:hypothetical protein [Candidatus Polarisedimenticolia bacterium]
MFAIALAATSLLVAATGAAGAARPAASAVPAVISIPPDSPRWELEGKAKPAEFQGRPCLMLDGGAATLKDLELRDGVIDVDMAVASTTFRGFIGIQFRIADEDAEWIYLRPHKFGYPDAIQYTPVIHTGLNWQIYSGPGFIAPLEMPRDTWFHLRLEVKGAQARFFAGDMSKPALEIPDLKSGVQKGQLALAGLTGETCFANFEVHPTADAPWQRRPPAMPPGTLTKWSISPVLDALARDVERPLSADDIAGMTWREVEAEPPGAVVLYRYVEAPHPRVAFATDFSKRLEPQPGTKVLYARTVIDSDRDQARKLALGYSDEVTVFLNGTILFRGRSAQNFRDPGFLGIMDAEDDAVWLPLRKGKNELMLAVTELGGGWGFVGRLVETATP